MRPVCRIVSVVDASEAALIDADGGFGDIATRAFEKDLPFEDETRSGGDGCGDSAVGSGLVDEEEAENGHWNEFTKEDGDDDDVAVNGVEITAVIFVPLSVSSPLLLPLLWSPPAPPLSLSLSSSQAIVAWSLSLSSQFGIMMVVCRYYCLPACLPVVHQW